MKLLRFLLLCLLVGNVVGCTVWGFIAADTGGYHHEGKVKLTEEEYLEFKEIISDDCLSVHRMEVLNSNEPIIIWYSIDAPRDFEFIYDEGSWNYPAILLAPIMIGLILTAILGVAIIDCNEDWCK